MNAWCGVCCVVVVRVPVSPAATQGPAAVALAGFPFRAGGLRHACRDEIRLACFVGSEWCRDPVASGEGQEQQQTPALTRERLTGLALGEGGWE
jgi:hypothetical protein